MPKLSLGRAAGASVPLPIPQPFAGLAPVSFKYWGGPIMSFAENETVLWGTSDHDTTLTSNLPNFLNAFATAGNSNPYNVALEYQTAGRSGTTTNQRITIASRYLGTTTILPSTSLTDLDDTDVQDELIHQISIGALPAPRVAFGGPVTEYFVMFPPTYTICIGSDCSDVDFCAYHSDAHFGAIPFAYAVLPESTPTDPGCGPSFNPGTGNLDSMASHEMVESMTDVEVGDAITFAPPLAWYDATNGEIADICNGEEASATFGGSTWTVQKQWSNTNKACEATHPAGGLQGVASSFTISAASGQAVFDASSSTTPNAGATITEYAWDWGDGTTSLGSSAVVGHAFATPGTHPVTLIATDTAGASGASFLSVTTRNLSVTATHGQVTSSPGGVACGATCSANFLDNTSIGLAAAPDPGYVFAGWTGDCAGQGATCALTMSGDRAASAIFNPLTTTLAVSTSGTGTGTVTSVPGGIACPSACSAPFASGTIVALTATPNAATSTFAGWSGGCSGSGPCLVTMPVAQTITASFALKGAPPPPPCVVPTVKGKTLAAASASLQAAHCKTGAITRRYSSRVAKGRVISQGVAAGTQRANGAAVSLVVSKGRAPFNPPVRVTICYRHRTLHVTRAVWRRLHKHGATLGRCRPRR